MYAPLAAWFCHLRQKKTGPLVVGLCGGQGSGKSTIAAIMEQVLSLGCGQQTVAISIDDFYKTREERIEMAHTVHPLFSTRGVPGTHDITLGINTLEDLERSREGEIITLPRFDKAMDTRAPQTQWTQCPGPLDVIILEGWCVGAQAQTEEALMEPINELEANEDPLGCWRREVNRALSEDYPPLFAKLNVLLLLQVSGMERVFAWRRLQEEKLRQQIALHPTPSTQVMSNAEVERFVMHYERITRHILSEMPKRAHAVFPIDETHNPSRVSFNA